MKILPSNIAPANHQPIHADTDSPPQAGAVYISEDVFESPPALSKKACFKSLVTLRDDIKNLDKSAHAIGENANEAWIRIWNLKSRFRISVSQFEAHMDIQAQLSLMRREVNAINAGLMLLNRHRTT